jgi:hypothetical protein
MSCRGCYGKTIEKLSSNEHFEKGKTVAKQMAVDTKEWYVVVEKENGAFDFMPQESYTGNHCGEILVRLSPVPQNAT